MKHFAVIFFSLCTLAGIAQERKTARILGTILNETTLQPVPGANVINVKTVKGAVTDIKGNFALEAAANDTLYISLVGYQSVKVRVTNDWVKNKTGTRITLTERAYTLEELVINKYNLTGYLQIDSKLIPVKENYRYSISGLPQGYEGGENSPNAFKRVVSSVFNPADALHNVFGKKPAEMRKLRDMKKDDTVRNALASKFDRETLAALLGVDKDDIAGILEHCNYSEAFIATANDLQIMDAISGCYEEYKALNRTPAATPTTK